MSQRVTIVRRHGMHPLWRFHMKHFILGTILGSMALGPIPVKAHAADLPSANNSSQSSKIGLADSAKNVKNECLRLVQTVMNFGQDLDFPDGFAQAIGLSGPTPTKNFHISISGHGRIGDDRDVHIIYSVESSKE